MSQGSYFELVHLEVIKELNSRLPFHTNKAHTPILPPSLDILSPYFPYCLLSTDRNMKLKKTI